MSRKKTGFDGDEHEDEDDNDGEVDDYDGGDGDNKSFQVQQQRMCVPSASSRITGSVAMLCIYWKDGARERWVCCIAGPSLRA